jgi:hypothetical protein
VALDLSVISDSLKRNGPDRDPVDIEMAWVAEWIVAAIAALRWTHARCP